jgi:hypothetical protein
MFGKDFFNRVRNLPEISKRRILIGSTFSITALIFIVWISVRFYGMNEPLNSNKKASSYAETPVKEVTSAIGQFADSLGEGVKKVKEAFSAGTVSTSTKE